MIDKCRSRIENVRYVGLNLQSTNVRLAVVRRAHRAIGFKWEFVVNAVRKNSQLGT